VKVGVFLEIGDEGRGIASWQEIRALAVQAEAAGLDSVWVYDHLLFRFGDETTGIHECWTILAALAEATERVELGTMVMCTSFRNPALLAKMAATLDEVSGGRLILGLGCGWHDPEYVAFGYPTDRKVSRFAEALEVVTSLIRTGRADLDGEFTTARDAVLVPPARPDLPILVAARKPRMLELTARYADAWNVAWHAEPDESMAAARDGLHAACARVERDPAAIAVTAGITVRYPGATPDDSSPPALAGSPADVARGLAAHAAFGVDHATVVLEPMTAETLAEFVEAVGLYRAAVGSPRGSSTR
jgi:alkanesulfonate monooxygenase SsuD/methylene tetrahydromethanopterin reductase-like flavin-dependent oxidoreductase (luciferase family)